MVDVRRVALPKVQIVGTRGQAPGSDSGGPVGGGGGTNYTRHDSRFLSRIGPSGCSALQLLYPNWYLTAGSGDTDGPNDVTLQAAIEITSPSSAFFKMQFNGAFTTTLLSGANVVSDPWAGDVLASADVWMRTGLVVTSGQQWPRGTAMSVNGERGYDSLVSANPTSQVYATGALALPSGTPAQAPGFSPLALIGIPQTPFPAAIILGDSIADGTGDDSQGDLFGNRGFIARGLWDVGALPYAVPWVKITMPSDNAIAQRIYTSKLRRFPWRYATHLISEHGGNQLQNVTAAQMLDHLRNNIWIPARVQGLRVVQVKLGPRTTCSTANKWTSAASQDGYASGFEPGGKRDTVNAGISAALAAGEIDYVIDPNAAWEDPANPCKWVTNGAANYPTTDGTHPSAAMHTLGGNIVRAVAATWS